MKPDLSQTQLFLDDRWIAESCRIQRIWHEAQKYPEPILKAEYPWEYHAPVAFGTILKRQDKFQMWYVAWTRRHHMRPVVCYAESDDGVVWHKPMLGLQEVCGTTQNNVVIKAEEYDDGSIIDDISVISDPEDSDWPLKALFWDGDPHRKGTGEPRRFGIWAARSKDGIQWEKIDKVLPRWGDRFNAISVKHKGRYVLFGRVPDMGHIYPQGRVVSRIESTDLIHWTKPELVLMADPEDSPHMEIYSATAFAYGDIMLGSIERMHMSPDKLSPELIWSDDDGTTWRRSRNRNALIPWGPPGTFDSDWINLTTNNPITHHDQLWIYYSGRSGAHKVQYPHNYGAIGLATLRIDGFCSIYGTNNAGWILTPPMTWPGGNLEVNVDPRRDITSHPMHTSNERLRVEVRDENNKPLAGFGIDDCHPITTNTSRFPACYMPLRFRDDKTLQVLKGKRLRLQFELLDTHLYAFRAGLT